jgi:hypothetical protein
MQLATARGEATAASQAAVAAEAAAAAANVFVEPGGEAVASAFS